jgi:hypothetical protein
MIGPGPDQDSNHPAKPIMPPTAAPPFPMALDLLAAVEHTARQAESTAAALASCCLDFKRLEDVQSGSVTRLQQALCQLETAATHLHHITQR